jgi:hypothetical protein
MTPWVTWFSIFSRCDMSKVLNLIFFFRFRRDALSDINCNASKRDMFQMGGRICTRLIFDTPRSGMQPTVEVDMSVEVKGEGEGEGVGERLSAYFGLRDAR